METLRVLYLRQDHPQTITEINNDVITTLQCRPCELKVCDLNPVRDATLAGHHQRRLELQKAILAQIREFSPHVAISYGFRGILPVDKNNHLLNLLNIPYFAICFDNLLHQQELIEACGNKDNIVILGIDPDLFPVYRKVGFVNCVYFPIATSFSELNTVAASGTPLINKPLFFVGGVSETPPLDQWLEQFVDVEQEFARFAASQVLDRELNRQDVILANFSRTFPQHGHLYHQEDFQFQKLWFKLDKYLSSCLRIKTVNAVADFGIGVCGSYQGWLKGVTGTNVQFIPNVRYRTQLPSLYRKAAIIINRSPLTLQNAIQQRCVDAGGVGGFILTERRPILEQHFEIGRELEVYDNIADLREKISYYLSHPDEREQIADNLHHKVMAEHTWEERVDLLLQIASRQFGQRHP